MTSPIRTFVVFAFALTWGIGGIALVAGLWMPDWRPLSPSSPLYYLAGYAVSVTGIALTAWHAGRAGLRALVARLWPRVSSLRWLLVVALGYAAMSGIALVVALARGTTVPVPHWSGVLTGLASAIIKDPGPLGEEFGWRGFALPRLLARHSPLYASLRLGLIHTAWHLPLFFIPGMPQAHVSFPLFMIGVIAIAIFDTALYFRDEANLLLAILVHLLANVGGGLAAEVGALNVFLAAEGIAAMIVLVAGGLGSTGLPPKLRAT